MKKKWFFIIGAALLLIGATAMRMQPKDLKSLPIYQEPAPDMQAMETLKTLGFTGLKTVEAYTYAKRRKQWDSVGLKFYGDNEIKKFLDDNNFIMGEVPTYVGETPMPKTAVQQISEGLSKLNKSGVTYTLTFTTNGEKHVVAPSDLLRPDIIGTGERIEVIEENVRLKTLSRLGVTDLGIRVFRIDANVNTPAKCFIISNSQDFNGDGYDLVDRILKRPPPKDPIAVAQVEDGWVVLANW